VAELTAALTANGLKAGGTKAQKIDRLFLLSTTPLDKIPNKHKTKDGAATAADNNSALFVLDFQLTALLRHYRPTLLATAERNKRRLTQTVAEKLAERREILSGNAVEVKEDDSDEEEEIYNPKNLPLGWDGKPIPVWLYKLHGLNKYAPATAQTPPSTPILHPPPHPTHPPPGTSTARSAATRRTAGRGTTSATSASPSTRTA
jgi:splicing factor 3A subunit 3